LEIIFLSTPFRRTWRGERVDQMRKEEGAPSQIKDITGGWARGTSTTDWSVEGWQRKKRRRRRRRRRIDLMQTHKLLQRPPS